GSDWRTDTKCSSVNCCLLPKRMENNPRIAREIGPFYWLLQIEKNAHSMDPSGMSLKWFQMKTAPKDRLLTEQQQTVLRNLIQYCKRRRRTTLKQLVAAACYPRSPKTMDHYASGRKSWTRRAAVAAMRWLFGTFPEQ